MYSTQEAIAAPVTMAKIIEGIAVKRFRNETAPVTREPVNDENELYSFLWESSFAEYPADDMTKRILYMCRFHKAGLVEARLGNLASSAHYFAHADTYLSSLPATREVELCFLKTVRLPALAYLYYRQGKYTKAFSFIRSAVDTDIFLEAHGYPYFLFHRVQQYQNECRMLFSQNKVDTALEEVAALIDLLIAGRSDASFLRNSTIDLNNEYMPRLRTLMLFQLVDETFLTLVMKTHRNFRGAMSRFFIDSFKNTSRFDLRSDEDRLLKEWIEIFSGLCLDGDGTWLERALVFLDSDTKKVEKLKYFLLLYLLQLSLEADLPHVALLSKLQGLSVPLKFYKVVQSLYPINQ
jgi:hypothetical protein